jgi:hypothetical protein
MARQTEKTWSIRYPSHPWLNTSITSTYREILEFAYGESERPVQILADGKLIETVH